ncbi:MAG: DUF1614 domain-containing protein [Thermoplasmata archaeon]|nr:DUF1614 domain-containing protein [Thermoplasmata archaeon]
MGARPAARRVGALSSPPGRTVVDPIQLVSDIVQADAFLLLPPLLWLVLFLFAWEQPALSARLGLGRTTFWLLLPGALLGTLSDLPFFGWQGAVLAVNLGGGLLPVLLSMFLFRRSVGDADRATALLLVALGAETGSMLMAVLLFPAGWVGPLLVVGAAAVAPLVLWALGSGKVSVYGRTLRRTGLFLALVSAVLVATYASTSTVPALGIVSAFPYYLIGPLAAGAAALLLAKPAFGLPRAMGIPLAYASATIGVLFGADLLREPPLYGNGPALYAIGGAGVNDLVYLSGLLALLAALVAFRLTGWETGSSGPLAVPRPSPVGRLRQALQHGLNGRPRECIETARDASHEASDQARLLYGIPPTPASTSPWDGLPVATWVVADQRNLDAVARSGTKDPREAFRAWLTARWLVGVSRELGRERFASLGTRSFAFLGDLALLLVPSVLAWIYVSKAVPGSVGHVLGSPLFNAAALALPAYGFLYFTVAEGMWGATVGKSLFGLRVTDRALSAVPWENVMVRNLPKLIPLTVLDLGGSLLVLALLRGVGGALGSTSAIGADAAVVILVAFLAVGVGVSGVASALTIHASSESQRVGDFFAGTWVVRDRPTSGSAQASPAPDAAPAPSG